MLKKICPDCDKVWYCDGSCRWPHGSENRQSYCIECLYRVIKRNSNDIYEKIRYARWRIFPNGTTPSSMLESCYGKNWRTLLVVESL